MGTPALRLNWVEKRYQRRGRDVPVLGPIDLSVAEGEVVALLGPSGCGKSTLLRIIAQLEPPTAGTVERLTERPVGLVFQDALLLPWLTVAENIAFGLGFRANRLVRQPGAVERALTDFGLHEVADAYPGELSGGQAQRASLARTVVTQPGLLLLDEPFAALDPSTRRALQGWFARLVRERGLTVLLVTHDIDEALALGDRVALLSPAPGRIEAVWESRALGTDSRDSAAAQALRREILGRYRSDLALAPPVESAA
ncbi:MAG: ABC transporter ATP-binding protein [Chloroflexi bacterium]|nr:ABC transporter ATP-binding protein [Chloroflexota bacterium]